jgi:Flp pilus assembly protein TadD
VTVAGPLAARDEHDAGPNATLGRAYLELGDAAAAEKHLVLAARVSPFDPEVRCGLAEVYTSTGDTRRATREQTACRALRK